MGKEKTERMFAFEDLLVWQKSIDFAEAVIKEIGPIYQNKVGCIINLNN